jgi:O-antigen/teichoic acid export membrane protein
LDRVREGYLKVLQVTAYFSFAVAAMIFSLASNFVETFMGPEWMPMVPAVRILVIAGLLRSVAATAGPVFAGIGKPRIETGWQVTRFVVLAVLIYPFILEWGISGAAYAVLASVLVSTIGFCYSVIKVTACDKKRFAKVLALPATISLVLVLTVHAVEQIASYSSLIQFGMLASCGAMIFVSMTIVFDRHLGYGIRPLLRETIRPIWSGRDKE